MSKSAVGCVLEVNVQHRNGVIYGLDLFSGIGGLSAALSPWVIPVAYCESDRFAQAVLLSRMRKGDLPIAPIWEDVTNLEAKWFPRDSIDIVYGGFPCQDISCAGNGAGLAGERSGLFFEILRLADEIKPTLLFIENVPAIRTRGADVVGEALANRGFDSRWMVVSAAEVGAPHLRNRWFLLAAHPHRIRLWDRRKRDQEGQAETSDQFGNDGQEKSLAYSNELRGRSGKCPPEVWERQQDSFQRDWWSIEPNVGRVAHGIPARVDRLRGLGNAVVPLQAREAFHRLLGLAEIKTDRTKIEGFQIQSKPMTQLENL